MSKRCRFLIIYDLMNAINQDGHTKKTKMMQMAYLDWRNFDKYFNVLIVNGFVEKNKECYKITEKGRILFERLKVLEGIRDLDEMLNFPD